MKKVIIKIFGIALLTSVLFSCKALTDRTKKDIAKMPESYGISTDTINTSKINWKNYFKDPYLTNLIDSALKNNKEINIVQQEIEISKNEVQARKGEYLPFVNLFAGSGLEKTGKYTRMGAVEENLEVKPGKAFPDPLGDFTLGLSASWEIDIWKKLRNSKKAAVHRYLSSIEGKNFLSTTLISEISNSYFELLALDNLQDIVKSNIEIQSNALKIIKQQKESAKVTQLAVNRFEAQLLNTQNLQYKIAQDIIETENKINFLVGRFPQPVLRDKTVFNTISLDSVSVGLPSQLLQNRPDIRGAEQELMAANLDVKAARANFYPKLGLKSGIGYQAFNPAYIISPESSMYNLAGDLVAPLLNRNAIKSMYKTATNKQIQAVYEYEQRLLNAYIEVVNQQSLIENTKKSLDVKQKEVNILNASVGISNSLFYSARADYIEVLLTQRETIDSKMELVDIKLKQLNAKVNLYKALGGGWN